MAQDIFAQYINNLQKVNVPTKAAALVRATVPTNETAPVDKNAISDREILMNIHNKLESLSVQSSNAFCGDSDISIVGGKIVLPDHGILESDLHIKDGKILCMGKLNINAKRTVNAQGKYIIPGIIDPHVHLGLFADLKQELATETKSAIIGGVTSLGCYFGGQEPHLSKFSEISNAVEQNSHVDIIPHLVIGNKTQKDQIYDYVHRLGVSSFKIYLNGIPGLITDVDDGFVLDVMDEIKKSGKKCLICVHAENRDIVRRSYNQVKEEMGDKASIYDWTNTHPEIAEEEAVIRLSYLAEKLKVDVYFVHISSQEAIQRLEKIKRTNPYVHVETTSPYLSISRDMNNFNRCGNILKMEPPFRDFEDVEELWKAVKNGTVDCIGTDNVTQTLTEKKSNDTVWESMSGYPALGTHLPVLLHEGASVRGISLEKLVLAMTKRPAEVFGVYPRKGTLLPGSDADVVLLDMNLEKQVHANELMSRSDFSLYEGRILKGWPVMTIKAGQIVAENGQYVGTHCTGSCLKR